MNSARRRTAEAQAFSDTCMALAKVGSRPVHTGHWADMDIGRIWKFACAVTASKSSLSTNSIHKERLKETERDRERERERARQNQSLNHISGHQFSLPPCITTSKLSSRFPIFETSATALCGTTGIIMMCSSVGLQANGMFFKASEASTPSSGNGRDA